VPNGISGGYASLVQSHWVICDEKMRFARFWSSVAQVLLKQEKARELQGY